MQKLTVPAAAAFGVAVLACPASAQTSTSANMNVTLTVDAACTIAANPLDFGTVGVITADVDAASSLVVQCTNGTLYTITLGPGSTAGGDYTNRLLTNGTSTVAYNLYTEDGRTTVWGDGSDGSSGVGATASGTAETIPVFGRVPVQPAPAVGTYTDVVVATITY